jgi:hypothetical protein
MPPTDKTDAEVPSTTDQTIYMIDLIKNLRPLLFYLTNSRRISRSMLKHYHQPTALKSQRHWTLIEAINSPDEKIQAGQT